MSKPSKAFCISCGKEIQSKNERSINLRLLGKDIQDYYCIDCLAGYLDVQVQDIYDKIEEFKDEGCKMFE